MRRLIYRQEKKGYYNAYEYAKSILGEMKKIVAFKAFSYGGHDYYEVIGNHRRYYNLILFDEASNEYWFDAQCGCKGMGSFYSEKILQLVGIREDYNIAFEKEIYRFNLSPNNKLNLLIVEIDLSNSIEKYFIKSLITLDFENAYLRYRALDSLQIFGVVKSIEDAIGGELYIKYFNREGLDERSYEEAGVNNILFLDDYLGKSIKLNISTNIDKLLESKSNIGIKEIKEIEYGIYTILE